MPSFAEKRHLPYTSGQMFDLVLDIERYPDFLPWCVAARIRRREGNVLYADLMIGFKMVRERFTSKVTIGRNRLDVVYTEGPFKHLTSYWVFNDGPDGGTDIDFYVDFEMRSRMLQSLMGAFFSEAVRLMVTSFETRAAQLYAPQPGRPANHSEPPNEPRSSAM